MPSLSPYKPELDYSYAPGIFPALECLQHRPGLVRRVLIHSASVGREGVDKLIALAEEHRIRVETADRALARISGRENCYAAAVFAKCPEPPAPEKPHVVLVQPSDCGNIGTIFRTALGFGIRDLVLLRPCADPFDPRTVRASMGSLFRLRVWLADAKEDYLAACGDRDLYPFMLDASVPMEEAVRGRNAARPFSLLFGNEGSGLPEAYARLGQPVRIPSNQLVDSLNLAIAAGIGIYAFTTGYCGDLSEKAQESKRK